MSQSRLRQLLGGIFLAVILGSLPAGAVSAANDCSMKVQPASGPPGTQFTFSGRGYTPSQFQLTNGGDMRTLPVDLAGADPWQFSFVAGDADVGRWKVVAATTGGGCQAMAVLRVTLPPTSTVGPAPAPDRTPMLGAVAALTLVFLFSAAVIFRRSRYNA